MQAQGPDLAAEKKALREKLIEAQAAQSQIYYDSSQQYKFWPRARQLERTAERLGISGFSLTVFEKAAELEHVRAERQAAEEATRRAQQEAEKTSQNALILYKTRKLKLADITSPYWIRCILDYTSDMYLGADKQKDLDFFVLREIAILMRTAGPFNVCVEIKSPTDAKVARWFSEQGRLSQVSGIRDESDFQSIIASRGKDLDGLNFQQLQLPCETLLTALSAHQCGASIKYNCSTHKYEVYFRLNSAPTLTICTFDSTKTCAEAPKTIQTLIDGFSPNTDFEITFWTDTFNPPIAWKNPRLKRVVIDAPKLSYKHVECLKQAAAAGIAVTLRDCNALAETKEKEMEITFMMCALAEAYPQKFTIQNQLFNTVRGEFISLSKQLDILVSRMEASNLLFDDLKDEKLWPVILATANVGISPLCKREAFQYLSAIAAVLTNPSQVTIANPFDLYAVQWALAQTHLQITVNGLSDPDDFAAIHATILSQAPLKRKRNYIIFKSIACDPEVFVPFVQGDNVQIDYHEQKGGLMIAPMPIANGASFSMLSLQTACDVAQWDSMLTLMRANPSPVRVYFYNNSFRTEFALSCSNINHLSFTAHTFTAAHFDSLEQIPQGQLRTMGIHMGCVIPEAVCERFFAFVHSRKIEIESCPPQLRHEYRAYCKEQERIRLKQEEENKRNNLVRELIQKYKGGTLSYHELFNAEAKSAIRALPENPYAPFRNSNQNIPHDIDRDVLGVLGLILNHVETYQVKEAVTVEFNRSMLSSVELNVKTWICQKQEATPTIIVKADLTNSVYLTLLNRLLNSMTRPFRLVFDKTHCAFVSGVDLSNQHLVGLELLGQAISAQEVVTLRQATQCRSVVASDCTFGTTIAEADANRKGCVEAVLGNQQLTTLTMTNCGLTKKHLDLVTDYLKTHRQLRSIVLENNAFREREDTEYKSWLAFYTSLEELETLPLEKAFEKLFNMIDVMKKDSERKQPNLMCDSHVRLAPFYVCANRIAFNDVVQCRKHIQALVDVCELPNTLQPEETRLVLQSVVDNALRTQGCALGILQYLPGFVRRHGLNDEGVCAYLLSQVETSLHILEKGSSEPEMSLLRDTSSVSKALNILFDIQNDLVQLRSLRRPTEKSESRFCDYAKLLTQVYVACNQKWTCESDLLLILLNMLERNNDKVLAAEVEQLVVKMQQQHAIRELKANGKRVHDIEKQTTLAGLMELLKVNLNKLPLMRQLIAKFTAVKDAADKPRRNSMELHRPANAPVPGAPPLVHLKEDDAQRMCDQFGERSKQPPAAQSAVAPMAYPPALPNAPTLDELGLDETEHAEVEVGELSTAEIATRQGSPVFSRVPPAAAPAPAPSAPRSVFLPDVPAHRVGEVVEEQPVEEQAPVKQAPVKRMGRQLAMEGQDN